MAEVGDPTPEGVTLDTSVAHPARVYDYWLGGKDNFAADREAAEHVIAANPTVLPGVRANRAFLGRAVRYLAAEAGIRQFLDLGTGLPTAKNTHQVAQEIAATPGSCTSQRPDRARLRRALPTSVPEAATAYVPSDIRDSEELLAGAAETLDLSKPVAVMALMVLQYIPDGDHPWGIVGHVRVAPARQLPTRLEHGPRHRHATVTEGTARGNQRMGPTQRPCGPGPTSSGSSTGSRWGSLGGPLAEWHGPGRKTRSPLRRDGPQAQPSAARPRRQRQWRGSRSARLGV